MKISILFLTLVSFLTDNSLYAAQKPLKKSHNSPDNWGRPIEPFQIADNTWYIGTEGLAALLIKTNAGAILVDGGIPDAAQMLVNHMKKFGVKPKDLKWIVYSHAHHDHAGPIAELKRITGAKVAANAESATLAARGGKDDIHFGDKVPFEPFKTDRLLMDGETVELGNISLKVHFTPAHTPGSHSWTWTDTIDGKPVHIAYVDSLSAPGYKLVNNPSYPLIVEDYRRGIEKVKSLPCDLLLTPHPEASGWNLADASARSKERISCKEFAGKIELKLDQLVKNEQ